MENFKSVSFEDFNEVYNCNIVKKAQDNILSIVISMVEVLQRINYNDRYKDLFYSMEQFAKIYSLLPYLDQDSLTELNKVLKGFSYTSDSYENQALIKIRKIIINRQIKESN